MQKDEIKRKIKGYVYNEDDEKKILDYITNLQEENKKLKNKLEDEKKNYKRITTYLQEENDDLKNRLENAVADCNLRLQENERLKELYKRTCKHLFNIGNDELARYFQAQISECNVFTTQGKSDE